VGGKDKLKEHEAARQHNVRCIFPMHILCVHALYSKHTQTHPSPSLPPSVPPSLQPRPSLRSVNSSNPSAKTVVPQAETFSPAPGPSETSAAR